MTPDEQLAFIIKKLKQWAIDRSCLKCMNWENEMCKKFKQRPPTKVIIEGCEHHDFIPF